ncbi:8513_t:CDS:2, partial [Diversispora eburnea]
LSLSCSWTLHWINKPEVVELFQFLNSHLKLPDHHLLGSNILSDAVKESNNTMIKVFQEDSIRVILTFDNWTNVRNEHLLGVVILTSEEVMEKTKEMFTELNNEKIKVCAVVKDSAGLYATS